MKKLIVDAMGQACPIPVVMTKNAIKELGEAGTVETLVDNEIAVQNLTKMANQKGYGVTSEKIAEGQYRVAMMIGEADQMAEVAEEEDVDPVSCIPDARKKKITVVIGSNLMGSGEEALGKTLMKAFLYALTQQDELPTTMLFYNSGVFMTTENSPSIEDLKSLEAQGVEILSCGTCLNFYGLTDKLLVGGVTNMYDIVEKQMQADLVIRP